MKVMGFGSLCSLAILSISGQNPVLVKPMKFSSLHFCKTVFILYAKLGLAFVCTVSPQNT